jgi:hypothetical protein
MDSKVEENYKRLREELNERLNNDKRLTEIMDKISKGTATFKDSAEYSQIVADHMGDVISKNIGNIKIPMGKEKVCKELLKENIERVDTVFGKVQVSVDEKMGIHLNPVTPTYPTERVNAIAHSLEDPNADDEKVARRGKSSGNVVAARHDENVKANAAWREKAGFDCYLVRDAGGGCCAWCAALAGRYKYADAPDDIFRRHDNCTCTVTYECGKMRQDVWSKESNWSKEQSQEYMRQHDAALAEKRKELRAKGVNVSNAKLNKEEIEAIKARIDASEAAKPTVNTPQQAKELERQALEKNPVTKLTPEQAKAIDEQSKPTVHTPTEAKELEDKILGNVNKNDVEILGENDIIKTEAKVEAASTFVNSSELLYEYAKKIEPLDDYQDIVIHGDKTSFSFRDKNGIESNVNVTEFANIYKESGLYNGGKIRLISCEAAAPDAFTAQRFADEMCVEVLAPTDIVWVHSDGHMTIGPDEFTDTGSWVSKLPSKEG